MKKLILDIEIGNNLRLLRKANRLTQADVTAKLKILGSDIERTTYGKIEAGQRNIRLSDLILLKYIFKAEYSDFFEGLVTPELQNLLKEYKLL